MSVFAYTILYVKDVQKSVTFYEKAFDLKKKFITPEGDYGEILSGGTTIAFATIELANANLKNGFQVMAPEDGIELGFTTENPKELMEKVISAGGSIYEPLAKKPWGQEVGYVRDIDGFLLEVCTPMSN